jgi:hypothetical protein
VGRERDGIVLNVHYECDGATVFKHACALGCEGKGTFCRNRVQTIFNFNQGNRIVDTAGAAPARFYIRSKKLNNSLRQLGDIRRDPSGKAGKEGYGREDGGYAHATCASNRN